MSDEIRELHGEINALKENVGMEEENEASKAQNSSTLTIAIPTSHPLQEEGGSSEFASNIKRPTKRYIQNWLIDSLPWIGRKELANSSLSTSCETFRQLCWPKLHQKVKPHKIPNLQCTHNRTQFRRLDTNEIIPIASTPAPHYIDGIGTIELSFVNEQIVDFAKSIDRLLQNCDLIFRFNHEMNQTEVASIHALLDCLANKIFKFILSGRTSLGWNDFNRLFPGILDQIQFLTLFTSLNIDDFHTLMNWLTNQSNDGKQKIIESNKQQESMEFAINHIKEEFSNSNSPSNFLIYFANFDQNFEEFTLENTRTNEVLTLYRSQNLVFYYLARYPKGEEHWKEDGQNKIQKGRALDSNIIISLL